MAVTSSSAPNVPEPPRRRPLAWSKAARPQSLASPPFRRALKKVVAVGVHVRVTTPGRPARRLVAQSLRAAATGALTEVFRVGAAGAGGAASARRVTATASADGVLMKASNAPDAPNWRKSGWRAAGSGRERGAAQGPPSRPSTALPAVSPACLTVSLAVVAACWTAGPAA